MRLRSLATEQHRLAGLSCGLTGPALPAGLKIVYILEMWVGRLEFMGVIALFGFIAALARGK